MAHEIPSAMKYRLASLLLALPACVFIVDDPPSDEPPPDTSAVLVTDRCPGDPAFVENAEVVGDRLVVTAGYGGCGATEVWACWDGAFAESFPVQASIAIHHADAGLCDAYITTTISVSLDPVIDAYADGYGTLDPITLHVGDFTLLWEP